ncbi:MAG: elongation factor P [Caldilinea sp. CFX5]|nr:elongation factor P [Caldilinea sp. CFX5]
MATTSDLRKGMLIRYNGVLQRVVEFQHISPGNWRAMVRMRLKNFKTGGVTEDRVRAGAEIDIVPTETRSAQFLYKTDDGYHFMDNESFDQIELSAEDVGESMRFIRENESVDLLVIQDENNRSSVIDVAPPNFVTLKVTEADVAVRGDTATNLQKNVTLETGAVIQAPAFIKVGDLLRIDTRSGEYVERAKQ